MATKSFTTDMKFSAKTAPSLLTALEECKKPKQQRNVKFTQINNLNKIKEMFK